MLPDIDELRAVVKTAAEQELLPRFADVARSVKVDGSIVTAADIAMQQRMQNELARRWPQYEFLGEETPEAEQRQRLGGVAGGLWCLDPLDGTSNFTAGVPFFAVSLALLLEGEPVIGLVYDPVRRECFTAQRGQGAWRDDARLGPRDFGIGLEQCLAAVDFKRLTPELAARLVRHPPYGSQRSFGSVALDWCWLAAGRFHVYLHGKQKLWDYAAGSLILGETGGHAITLEGEEIGGKSARPLSVIAALDEALFRAWRAWLGV